MRVLHKCFTISSVFHLAIAQNPYNVADRRADASPVATIDSGVVVGTTTSLPSATAFVNKFLGIPFAASPPLRFGRPELPVYHGIIDATAVKAACIQQIPDATTETLFSHPAPAESEDCLYLNVFAPSTPAPAGGRAVIFFIYGGGFMFGNAGQPMYDGSALATYEDVVVVTTNYRTNVFGFPNSPEIALADRNLGFLDQRFALEWVQRNIHVFGGNPAAVTVWGQSAGSMSIDALITSYAAGSAPPFHAAILDSGIITYDFNPFRQDSSGWEALVTALDCPGAFGDDLTCVRAADVDTIHKLVVEHDLRFPPQHDNVTFYSDATQRRADGDIASTPILTGSNAQDGATFVGPADNFTAFLSATFPNDHALQSAIAAAYPLGPELPTQHDRIVAVYTDAFFTCPAMHLADTTAATTTRSTWRYLFNATFPNTQPLLPSENVNLGPWHSSELYQVFGFPYFPTQPDTAHEASLSRAMMGAWAAFARDPAAGPGWAAVGNDAALAILQQDGGFEVVDPATGVDGRCYLLNQDFYAWTSLRSRSVVAEAASLAAQVEINDHRVPSTFEPVITIPGLLSSLRPSRLTPCHLVALSLSERTSFLKPQIAVGLILGHGYNSRFFPSPFTLAMDSLPSPSPSATLPKAAKIPKARSFAPPHERAAQQEAAIKQRVAQSEAAKVVKKKGRGAPLTTRQKLRAEAKKKAATAAAACAGADDEVGEQGKQKPVGKAAGLRKMGKRSLLVEEIMGEGFGDGKGMSGSGESEKPVPSRRSGPTTGLNTYVADMPRAKPATQKTIGVLLRHTARAQKIRAGQRLSLRNQPGMKELFATLDGPLPSNVRSLGDAAWTLAKMANDRPEDMRKVVQMQMLPDFVSGCLRCRSGSAKAASGHRCHLLALPNAVRSEIIKLVVVDVEFFIVPASITGKEQPDLAMANRQLRAEVLPIFYSHNTFCVELLSAGQQLRTSPLASTQAWVTAIGPRWPSMITKWVFSYDGETKAQRDSEHLEHANVVEPFYVSIHLAANSANATISIHREACCILSGHAEFGRCTTRFLAPTWLEHAVCTMSENRADGVWEIANLAKDQIGGVSACRCDGADAATSEKELINPGVSVVN
nr:acetylcholinesterase [Quercus suber]